MSSLTAWGIVLLIAVFLIWSAARAWRAVGKSRAEAIAAKRAADQAKESKKIDDKVKGMSDDELDKHL